MKEALTNQKVNLGGGKTSQANTNNDAYLTLAELFTFTKERVTFLTRRKKPKQTPDKNKELSELELPIFYFGTN